MSTRSKGCLSMDDEGGSFLTVSGSPALAELWGLRAKGAQRAGSGKEWLR